MLPVGTEVEGANGTYTPMGAPRISYASPPYSGALALKLAVEKLEGKDVPKRVTLPLPLVTNETIKILQGRHLAGNEGGLQRLPAGARPKSRLVRLDLLRGDAGSRVSAPRWSASRKCDLLTSESLGVTAPEGGRDPVAFRSCHLELVDRRIGT